MKNLNASEHLATVNALRAALEREKRREIDGGYMSAPRSRPTIEGALNKLSPGWHRKKW